MYLLQWPQKQEPLMTDILVSLSELEALLLRGPQDPSWTVWHVVAVAAGRFLPALHKNLDFGDPDVHDDYHIRAAQFVRFGPHGYGVVIQFFDSLFTAACNSQPPLPEHQFEHVFGVVESASVKLYCTGAGCDHTAGTCSVILAVLRSGGGSRLSIRSRDLGRC
jgi:hypothetical protein